MYLFNIPEMISNLSLFSSNILLLITISFVLQLSLVLLYLIDFKSSFSRLVIILLFSIMLFIYFLLVCDNTLLYSTILSIDDVNTNIGTNVKLEGHVHMNDEQSGKSLAATGAMLGVGALVGKTIAKAPMPPLQKAGAVVIGAAIGGGLSVGANYFNAALNGALGISNSPSGSTISKLVGDSQLSPLQGVLF
jgi:hypothetical protein